MNNKRNIGIIGLGNMGAACAVALNSSGAWQVYAYDIKAKNISLPKDIKFCKDIETLFKTSQIILIAIKPQDIANLLDQHKALLNTYKPLCISVAAGLNTNFFQNRIKQIRLIRTMPNLGAKVGQSLTFICRGKYATTQDLAIAKDIFSYVGEVIITKEDMLDKATSISGSGPGYVYYFMDILYESAIKLGFNKNQARKIILQVFLGAVNLAKASEYEFKHLVEKVTSPKGTTEAALKQFKKYKLADKIDQGIIAAYQRAKEIAKLYN